MYHRNNNVIFIVYTTYNVIKWWVTFRSGEGRVETFHDTTTQRRTLRNRCPLLPATKEISIVCNYYYLHYYYQ